MQQASLLDVIAQNPDAVPTIIGSVGAILGTALGAISAIIGIWITNRHNNKLQARQLKADVYLPAAEALLGMVQGLASLLNLQVSRDTANEKTQPLGVALTRIQMVATPATISRAADLQRAFIETIGAANLARIRIENRQAEIDSVAAEEEALLTQLGALRRAMQDAQGDRHTAGNSERHAEAYVAYQIVNGSRVKARMRRLAVSIEQKQAQANQIRDLVSSMKNLVDLQSKMLAAIRVELVADEALQLITQETARTNTVGVRVMTDAIPMIEKAENDLRQELADLERKQLSQLGKE